MENVASNSAYPAVPGEVIEFYYPEVNEIGIRPRVKRRRVMVSEVRDLHSEPLSTEEVAQAPYVRYSRFKVTGVDLVTSKEGSFWIDWQMPVGLEVIHSDGERVGIVCGKTRYDRACFGEICAQLSAANGLRVAIRCEKQVVGIST